MKKVIPQVVEVYCDTCNHVCQGFNYKMKTRVTVKQHALDMLGDPACDGTYELDLCDICSRKLYEVLKNGKL